MIGRLFIANRGEIAVRLIKTCRRLGVETVAAYSDADLDSLAVDLADAAVRVGPARASESYLDAEGMLRAAKEAGADGVHPGFGFLAENAAFARAVSEAGLAWVGPNAAAIEAMGDKITSKKIAAEAGVAVVPGFVGAIDGPDQAVKIADDIGYPVMIKATAGGGGKGMRAAFSAEEVAEGFVSAQNEARGAFGDERIFIEKLIQQPRHIEIQVLADKMGATIHLGERECSIQR
ncbi:MAG: acetyl/propionyl-CoA carboxylase subunit alpha, partial [Caulobacterales bacterium]|nr:acetyl/propionyl-CoA carboxylase subunit alpha [Caulobacterales bacterium]